MLAQEGRGFAFIEGVSEENIQAGLKHDLSYVCTNGFGCSLSHPEQNKGPVHPRCFGAMPRFLARYVRDGQLMNWEAGIHKISAGPAQKIGLKKRGLLKKNNFADITIFNPQAIKDKATFDNPFQKPEGIKYVIVNGKVVIEEGEQKDELAGQILRNN